MTDTIPPDYELLVGSQAFWQRAQADIAAAHRRVLIQAMTFEGDSAGQAVAAAIAASGAADRRVLVDDYTRHVINDTFLSRSRDEALHAEAQATWAMFDRLADAGVGLRITNPVGRNPLRYALRNHKKLLVMDDAVWLGGINFSEHNFAWHDMMLRIAHPGLAGWLAAAFERDWQGECGAARAAFPGIEMLSVDGSGNAAHLAPLLDLFAGARRRIEVISAYPTFPFVSAMASAARGAGHALYPAAQQQADHPRLSAGRGSGIGAGNPPAAGNDPCEGRTGRWRGAGRGVQQLRLRQPPRQCRICRHPARCGRDRAVRGGAVRALARGGRGARSGGSFTLAIVARPRGAAYGGCADRLA